MRTPSYLVRYTPLSKGITDDDVWAGIKGQNSGRIVLLDRWLQFAERLTNARSQIRLIEPDEERYNEFSRIKAALLGAESDDDAAVRRGASLHPVRRASGQTDRHVRERLIALFNTPFAPDLLVASSVMGEGIDLHHECRFVIHHDLDWNPSVLEQRTGRQDRGQWFDVVMGRPSGSDDHATDAEETRMPLHDKIKAALTMDLRSPGGEL